MTVSGRVNLPEQNASILLSAIAHDQNAADVALDQVQNQRELHLFLSNDGAERVHRGSEGGVRGHSRATGNSANFDVMPSME